MSEVNETGVVLPWEKLAIRGEEMPDGLDYPEQILYLQLRMLYEQKRHDLIDRETAIREKKKLLGEYRANLYREKMGEQWSQVIRDTELARARFRKEQTIESAWNLLNVIEGRHLDEITV